MLVGAILLVAPSASAARAVNGAGSPDGGILTRVTYSGYWTHTYEGAPSGIAKNPGKEYVDSFLSFSESVSLFTPFEHGKLTPAATDSRNSPVQLTLSGFTSVTYKGNNQIGCSAVFTARSGISGNDWYIGGFGQPLAYISVNQRNGTEGQVGAWAEAPGLRSSVHPEFITHRSGGNPDDTSCVSPNLPGGPICDALPLVNDPEYTPSDRGWNQPPYGFLHTVAKLNPQEPSYSHPYKVDKVISSCDGTDHVTAQSTLTVTNSRANGPAAPPPPPPPDQGKQLAKLLAQEALRDILPEATLWCGEAALGVGAVTIGGAGLAGAGIAVVGAQMFIIHAPICIGLENTIFDDLRIIDDPPLGHLDELAPVRTEGARAPAATCPQWHGRPPNFCSQFNAVTAALVAGANRLSSVASAGETTIGRESGAIKQHNRAAAKRQDKHLAQLNTQAQAALKAYLAASARFAALLRQAGFHVTMSKAQDAKAINALLRRLSQAGIKASALRQLAGDKLVPGATDVLTLLGGNGSTTSNSTTTTPTSPATTTTPTSPAATPTITSVSFEGSVTKPTIVIHGTNFGTAPKPDPAAHPSGLNGCPTIAGDNGYLYGTSLYIAVPLKNFAGGRYRPELNETDCLDLVVTKFTPTEVAFHFGPFYTKYYPQFALTTGMQAYVVVNGANYTTTIKYG